MEDNRIKATWSLGDDRLPTQPMTAHRALGRSTYIQALTDVAEVFTSTDIFRRHAALRTATTNIGTECSKGGSMLTPLTADLQIGLRPLAPRVPHRPLHCGPGAGHDSVSRLRANHTCIRVSYT